MLLPRWMLVQFGLILVSISQFVHSKQTPAAVKDATLSDQSDESNVEISLSIVTTTLPPTLLASNSDQVESRSLKSANNIAEIIRGEEKYKTAAQTRFGYSPNELGHNPSIPTGPHSPGSLGIYPGYGQHYPGAYSQGFPGNGLVGPGYAGHGVGLGGGLPIGHGHGHGHGVVYGGHGYGSGLPFGREQVSVDKQTEVGIGPYGEDHRRDTVQKSINRVEGGGLGIPPTPLNYYGDQGVVYMGGGLAGEHFAHHQRHNPLLNRQPTPFDSIPVTFNQVNPVDVGLRTINTVDIDRKTPYPYPYHQGGPFHHGASGIVPPGGYGNPGYGYGGGYANPGYMYGGYGKPGPIGQSHPVPGVYPHPIPGGGLGGPVPGVHPHPVPGGFQQQGISINKQSEVAVDPYGGVHRDVNVQKTAIRSDGLGYNGVQNNVLAHTDQAYIRPGFSGHTHTSSLGGPGGYDPYLNQLNPFGGPGGHHHHDTRLLTTGPNRFYQGANPEGIYSERHHRFG